MEVILAVLILLGLCIGFKIKTSRSNRTIAAESTYILPSTFQENVAHQTAEERSHNNLTLNPTPAFNLPSLNPTASTHMTMGLRRLDHANWLTIDEKYLDFHRIRKRLLADHKASVIASLPPSCDACQEVLSLVTGFLTIRYPKVFEIYTKNSCPFILNRQTHESFPLRNNCRPLETAARLAMEDFNILIKDDKGVWRLQASATLFPAGWRLEERIGGTLDDLHGPVPKWSEKLGCSVSRYFDHLSPKTAMERYSLFVQATDELFQETSLATTTSRLTDYLSGTHPTHLGASTIHLRRERQTFVPLPLSTASSGQKAVLFGVRTYLQQLITMPTCEIEALVSLAEGWSEDMAAYKGRDAWLSIVKDYLEEKRDMTRKK